MSFFPEDVQNEIISRLRVAKSVERPYSEHMLEIQKEKYREWDKKKETAFLDVLKDNFVIKTGVCQMIPQNWDYKPPPQDKCKKIKPSQVRK